MSLYTMEHFYDWCWWLCDDENLSDLTTSDLLWFHLLITEAEKDELCLS